MKASYIGYEELNMLKSDDELRISENLIRARVSNIIIASSWRKLTYKEEENSNHLTSILAKINEKKASGQTVFGYGMTAGEARKHFTKKEIDEVPNGIFYINYNDNIEEKNGEQVAD